MKLELFHTWRALLVDPPSGMDLRFMILSHEAPGSSLETQNSTETLMARTVRGSKYPNVTVEGSRSPYQ